MLRKIFYICCLALIFSIFVGFLNPINVQATENVLPFLDVRANDWYYESVKYVYENELIKGYNNETFAPQENLKREQLVSILWRMEKNPDTSDLSNEFTDVLDNEWYTDAIKWAVKAGITKGYGDTKKFGLGDNIIRQDMIVMIANYAKYKGFYLDPIVDLSNFKDGNDVSGYAKDTMRWAIENGIITGNNNSDGSKTIKPLAETTRCETAVILQRFHKENAGRTIRDGIYKIKSAINPNYILDIWMVSQENGGNVHLWLDEDVDQQKFIVTYIGDGYYTMVARHSNKAISIDSESNNVYQYEQNDTDGEKWLIKDAGDGKFNVISKANDLYLESNGDHIINKTNIQVGEGNNSETQKFIFEQVEEIPQLETGTQTIEDGVYEIRIASNQNYILDVSGISHDNGGNIQLWQDANVNQQRFKVTYQGDGYYTFVALHSKKAMAVSSTRCVLGINVWQYENNGDDSQKWIIKDVGNGLYSIIAKTNGLYLEASSGQIKNGTNIQVGRSINSNSQKFAFTLITNRVTMDTSKYPGYKERINALADKYPTWNFELLYTGLSYSDVISGETAVHSRNLVPRSYSGEWICPACGTKLYDSGWYCASAKAVAFYMDPRNFLDEEKIFQFVDVNRYINEISLGDIETQVAGTFLEDYAEDVETACYNTDVNPFYIISRLIQEQGRKGTRIGTGMDGGDGYTYYNPFNIGASGNGYDQIYANALAKAKSEGWNTMEKALEGGIAFCKRNWLDNYQNTLYQNKFDIDTRNGTALYNHQYMQNLMAAESEAKLFLGMYKKTDLVESNITFIIPVYEDMDEENYEEPSSYTESYPMNVETTGTNVRMREEANTNSAIIRTFENKGARLLSVQRGINSNWQKVITIDGTIGYISGNYVTQIEDITTCNYKAIVKTNDGDGCYVRVGPSLRLDKITCLADDTSVTVIDDSIYKSIDEYDWSRIIMPNGSQAFIPSKYLKAVEE